MATTHSATHYGPSADPIAADGHRARIAVRGLGAALALTAFAVTGSAWAAQAHADPIQPCHEGFCGIPTINLLPSGSAGIIPAATPPVKPVASPLEDSAAISAFAGEFGAATAVGGFGGTVIGAGVGCAIGAGVIAIPTALIGTPVGCLAGAVAGAGVGGVAGTIVVGGPTLALAGTDLVGTLTAPAGTSKWAQR